MKRKYCPVCKKMTNHKQERVMPICQEHDWRAERDYLVKQREEKKKNWEDQ